MEQSFRRLAPPQQSLNGKLHIATFEAPARTGENLELEWFDRNGYLTVRHLLDGEIHLFGRFGVAHGRGDSAAAFQRTLVIAGRSRDYFLSETIEGFGLF
jgi:hypothetical protein